MNRSWPWNGEEGLVQGLCTWSLETVHLASETGSCNWAPFVGLFVALGILGKMKWQVELVFTPTPGFVSWAATTEAVLTSSRREHSH